MNTGDGWCFFCQMLSPSWAMLRIRKALKDQSSPQFAMGVTWGHLFPACLRDGHEHVTLNHRVPKFQCPPFFTSTVCYSTQKKHAFIHRWRSFNWTGYNLDKNPSKKIPPGSRTRGFFIATNVPNLELLSWWLVSWCPWWNGKKLALIFLGSSTHPKNRSHIPGVNWDHDSRKDGSLKNVWNKQLDQLVPSGIGQRSCSKNWPLPGAHPRVVECDEP